jgi:hypothetical protein
MLFRNFRTYDDVLLDMLMALILAFVIAPPPRHRPAAVVIDCSRAMTAGDENSRPLDKALRRILKDPELKGAEPFALAFDPGRLGTHLLPLRGLLDPSSVEASSLRLRSELDFFSPDYARLSELRDRGYGEITLLTDQLRIRPIGFKAIEVGFANTSGAYPASVRYDRSTETWRATLVETGPRMSLKVLGWDSVEEEFMVLPPERYALEEGLAGRIVRFSAPGLYLLHLQGPSGQLDVDLPLLLSPSTMTVAASGVFSERMLAIFPGLVPSRVPDVWLQDQGVAGRAAARRVVSAVVKEDGGFVLDPAASRGALLAVGWKPGVQFTLGPSSLSNEDLVLPYDSILSRNAPAFLVEPPREGRLIPAGTAYLVRVGPTLLPLIPPASEFFETRPGARLVLPPPVPARWPWALLLAFLVLVKLVAGSMLAGKSWLTRD